MVELLQLRQEIISFGLGNNVEDGQEWLNVSTALELRSVPGAAEDNWQLLDIAAQTGHKDVNVLRKHYAKMQGEHLAKKLNGTGDN